MINFEDYVNENKTEHNENCSYIPDKPYRILIIGGSGSGKTNVLLNLIENQLNIDKIYLYAKGPYEAKYQYLINKREGVGILLISIKNVPLNHIRVLLMTLHLHLIILYGLENYFQNIIKIMTINDQIRDEKLRYDINREAAKISALSSGKIHKYEYLTGEDILPSNQQQIIEQARFTYSPLGKAFEKQTKTIEDQRQKQVEVLNTLTSNKQLTMKDVILKNALNNDEAK